jgi:hypothetical protein
MHSKYVLGIDPGSAKLGMSCVKWNGKDCNDEKNYSIEWMCLIHLTDSFKGKEIEGEILETNASTEIVKYKEMHFQIDRLYAFLDKNENFNAVLKLPGLRACIEQQEGARDINVLFRLMRINFLSGFMCCYLKRKKIPFTFVPKTYKCGWSYMGALAKKKVETLQSRLKNPTTTTTISSQSAKIVKRRIKKDLTPERKRILIKQYKKEAVCAFVRRVVQIGESSESIKEKSKQHKDADFNHMADSTSQAMRYVKEMKLSGRYDDNGDGKEIVPLKKIKDNVSNDMKTYLSNEF